jgi:hypothetical protein
MSEQETQIWVKEADERSNRFYDFMLSVTDNDTVIIVGLLIILAFVMKDVQLMIVGGLLTALKTQKIE